MKKLEVCLVVLFVASLLLPSTLVAQETSPPRCCPTKSNSVGVFGEDAGMASFQGQFVVSDETLQVEGLARSQFVYGLSESLFPGEAVDLVFPWAIMAEQDLIEAQESFLYRIPLNSVTTEELDMLDQLGLTDGIKYVTVLFVGRACQATN